MKRILSLAIVCVMIITVLSILGAVSFADGTLPGALDLTGDTNLPPIADQGAVGACVSMAAVHMQYTNAFSRYMHREYPGITWDPSSGDPSYVFSPRFTLNLGGAGTAWVYEIMKEQGTVPQTLGAFSGGVTGAAAADALAFNWNTYDGVWDVAQYCRISNYDQVWVRNVDSSYAITTTSAGRALIERIKQNLNDGNVVVTGGYPARWVTELVTISSTGTFGKAGDQAIPYSTGNAGGGHQVAIIGYDDDITCVKNGVVLRGAFKIANSWGTGWLNDGCVWMMYDAFNGEGESEYEALNTEDRVWTMDQVVFHDWRTEMKVGTPELMAKVTLTTTDRDGFKIILTRTDRRTNATTTYTPYTFEHINYHANYNQGLGFYGKVDANGTTGTMTFNYENLIESIPSGKTTDDYRWGVQVNGCKDGVTTTVNKVEFLRDGKLTYILPDLNDAVAYRATKSYVPTADRSGSRENGGWTLNGGTLTVFGSGDMPDYTSESGSRPWDAYSAQITKVVVDDSIPYIGAYAFAGLTNLTSVVCDADVTSIGDYAFAGCSALSSITFGAPVGAIGEGTVDGCTSLSAVTLNLQREANFKALAQAKSGNGAYDNATFTEIFPTPVTANGTWSGGTWNFTNGVLTVNGSGAIPEYNDDNPRPWADYKDDVEKVVIGSGITEIGKSAFKSHGSLKEIVCGADVTRLDMDCFAYNGTLETVIFNGRITSIAQGAVYSTGLKNVVVTGQTPDEFKTIASRAPYNDAFVNANVAYTLPEPEVKKAEARIYKTGIENNPDSPNAGVDPAVTQILFSPSDWDGDYYKTGMTVTVRMRAKDGSSDHTFTTTVEDVYDGTVWGVCAVEPCMMDHPWVPVKDKHYTATFTFVDAGGETATSTVVDDYYITEDPVESFANPAVYCDIDRSGRVNVIDVTIILNLLKGVGNASSYRSADLNQDGGVTISDLTTILTYLRSE